MSLISQICHRTITMNGQKRTEDCNKCKILNFHTQTNKLLNLLRTADYPLNTQTLLIIFTVNIDYKYAVIAHWV
jgi:hypothetical protein